MPGQKILNIANPNKLVESELVNSLGISNILARVLSVRGLSSPAQAEKFLKPKTSDLLSPFDFRDMHKAVELVNKSVLSKKKIILFGDYDVDGITSLVVLKNSFMRLGLATVHLMPNRIKEGYGLGKGIKEAAAKHGSELLITADCGISNHQEIKELEGAGINVIVTDHHQPQSGQLPPASAIINPKTQDSGYSFKELAGVGVAYKFCQALTKDILASELDLVALGTIADVVPLLGENRIIAREGLSRLSNTQRPGLKALIESAGIRNRKFNTTAVSFILGPRINASGRMGQAEVSFNLLVSSDEQEARDLAKVVELFNRERQKVENQILEEAEHLINKEVNFKEHRVIVIAKEDWHHGVLGIVASKLADRFCRPAIVISLSDELCKGSGRSVKNFHLFGALSECSQFLDSFGGHSHAAGLVITRDNIDDFRESINRFAHQNMTIEDLLPSIDVDAEISFADINEKVAFELESLEPFGAGNREPLFFCRDLKLKGYPQVLGRDTLKFWATDSSFTFQVIGFGMSGLNSSLIDSKTFDLVFSLRMDNWQGESSIILEAKDIFLK
jgi:single-stranded-DNA-specific exonuclease